MQRKLITAAITAGLLSACGIASAAASAKIEFNSAQTFELASSGGFSDGYVLMLPVSPLQTLSVTLDYTVELKADGLPASRSWTFCMPVPGYCGPQPTGSELAEAALFVTWYQGGGVNDDLQFTGSAPAIFDLSSGTATYQGTMSFAVTNTASDEPRYALVGVWGGVFVDANAIPEPATQGLLLAGLATIALTRRRTGRTTA